MKRLNYRGTLGSSLGAHAVALHYWGASTFQASVAICGNNRRLPIFIMLPFLWPLRLV